MKKKRFLVIGLLFTSFLLINGIFVYYYLDYGTMKIKSEFSQKELEILRDEYHLSDDAHIEYSFSQGMDMHGIRVRLTGVNDSTNVDNIANGIFDCNIICDSKYGADRTIQYYTENNEIFERKSTSGLLASCVPMPPDYIEKLSEITGDAYYGLGFFRENGNWYIEIFKP